MVFQNGTTVPVGMEYAGQLFPHFLSWNPAWWICRPPSQGLELAILEVKSSVRNCFHLLLLVLDFRVTHNRLKWLFRKSWINSVCFSLSMWITYECVLVEIQPYVYVRALCYVYSQSVWLCFPQCEVFLARFPAVHFEYSGISLNLWWLYMGYENH